KYGSVLHPRELIRRLTLSDADAATAAVILDEADLGIDVLTRRLIDATRAASRLQDENYEEFGRSLLEDEPDDESKLSEPERQCKQVSREIAAEYVRLCGRMAGQFSPEGRRTLLHARMDFEQFQYTMTRFWQFAGRDIAASYALSCKTLTPEQKRALKDLASAAKGQMRDALLPDLAARDASLAKGEKWTPTDKRVAECAELAEKLYKQLEKDAQFVLTPEQIAEVDYRRPTPEKLRKMFHSKGSGSLYGGDEDDE
ncbi:MAG: Spy/CpxP family protein refolding chaperone, partial [Phycisphaerales bacterium]|nr:Spy/CpxP family protein refolding chaperone [Phycisphaerales bacterium]